jgi:hypothetical protein
MESKISGRGHNDKKIQESKRLQKREWKREKDPRKRERKCFYFFFKLNESLFIRKREMLQNVHNSNEADRFIQAMFTSHVFI